MLPVRSLGMGVSTFFVSRERCRLSESLLLVDLMRRLQGIPASVSLRAGGRFIVSSGEAASGSRSEDDVVEIADYDPVRHSVLAVGLKEPSPDTPLHWLAYRTDELVRAAAFVWDFDTKKGVDYVTVKHPWGSFPEAMSVLGLARQVGGPAGVEGRGYLVRAGSADELVRILAEIREKNQPKANEGSGGKKSAPAKKKATSKGPGVDG